MSDDQDPVSDEAGEAEAREPHCGERLAEARREQKIPLHEVAKELHLDETKVRALERNEFDLLGAPVFAKGHLRKYAQLVGVDPDDIFADYYTMTRADGVPPIVAKRKRIRQEMSPGPWLAVFALLVVAAAAYWWLVVRVENLDIAPAPPADTAPSQPAESVPVPLDENNAPDPETEAAVTAPEPTPEAATDPETATDDVPSDAGAVAAEVVDPEPPASDQIRLTLNFSGECWTEISDADGEQLFFRMGQSGQTIELSGRAPISALFGNAENVSVRVNDAAYSLPPPNGANRMVRVAILNPT